jgi:hypothetical protein
LGNLAVDEVAEEGDHGADHREEEDGEAAAQGSLEGVLPLLNLLGTSERPELYGIVLVRGEGSVEANVGDEVDDVASARNDEGVEGDVGALCCERYDGGEDAGSGVEGGFDGGDTGAASGSELASALAHRR